MNARNSRILVPLVFLGLGTLLCSSSLVGVVGDGDQALDPSQGWQTHLTFDRLAHHSYLKASNAGAGDDFGFVTSASGDTLVIAAPGERSNATGVDGDQSNNSSYRSGAAYVFVRDGASWIQQAYLKASNTGTFDHFGDSLAISGDTIVVGAPLEDSSATGVNGDQSDNSAQDSGAAYVFVRNGTIWSQQAYLKASNTDPIDQFGFSVAISGNMLIVGALTECSGASGVDGDQSDNTAPGAGAAYVFVRHGSVWTQHAYLKASNTDTGDQFGCSVAFCDDTVLIGAFHEDSVTTGVNGYEGDNSTYDAGAAYVFVRDGWGWSQQAYLKASNTEREDQFGRRVALCGDTAIVTAPWEDSIATGVNGGQSNNSASNSGAAYVFERTGRTWDQQAYLKASNTDARDFFGFSVGTSDSEIAVGAPAEDSHATGANGDQNDDSAPGSGAVYLFRRDGPTWSQRAYLKASNTDAADAFGFSVALSNETFAVGARGEDSIATGVNGDQGDNSEDRVGAAYVLAVCASDHQASETPRLGTPPNPYAFLPGVTTGPIVGATWDPVVTRFQPGDVAQFIGLDFRGPLNVPTKWGTLLIWPPSSSQLFFNVQPGTPFAMAVPEDCSLVGVPAWAQALSVDAAFSFVLANGLDLVFGTY